MLADLCWRAYGLAGHAFGEVNADASFVAVEGADLSFYFFSCWRGPRDFFADVGCCLLPFFDAVYLEDHLVV